MISLPQLCICVRVQFVGDRAGDVADATGVSGYRLADRVDKDADFLN